MFSVEGVVGSVGADGGVPDPGGTGLPGTPDEDAPSPPQAAGKRAVMRSPAITAARSGARQLFTGALAA
jgi:hypothetical protein